jgi:hypothetical protein
MHALGVSCTLRVALAASCMFCSHLHAGVVVVRDGVEDLQRGHAQTQEKPIGVTSPFVATATFNAAKPIYQRQACTRGAVPCKARDS